MIQRYTNWLFNKLIQATICKIKKQNCKQILTSIRIRAEHERKGLIHCVARVGQGSRVSEARSVRGGEGTLVSRSKVERTLVDIAPGTARSAAGSSSYSVAGRERDDVAHRRLCCKPRAQRESSL